MTLETLNTFPDDDLRAIIAHAGSLLKQRDRERKENALEQAKAILSQAGLSLKELSKTKPRRAHESLRAGMRFFNSENPHQAYEVGKGRPPGWFTNGKGKPMPANDAERLEPVKKAV